MIGGRLCRDRLLVDRVSPIQDGHPEPSALVQRVSGRSEHGRSVDLEGFASGCLPSETLDPLEAAGSKVVSECMIGCQFLHGCGQSTGRQSVGVEHAIAADLGNRRDRHGDDRSPRRHRLQRRKAKSLVKRGEDKGLGVLIENSKLIGRDGAEELQAVLLDFRIHLLVKSSTGTRWVTGQDQPRNRPLVPACSQPCIGLEQAGQVLVWEVGRHAEAAPGETEFSQDRGIAGLAAGEPAGIDSQRHDDDLIFRNAELFDDLVGMLRE